MDSTCSVDECVKAVFGRGYCRTHYWRFMQHGDAGTASVRQWRRNPPDCTVDGCDSPVRARGYCGTHYARWRKTGDPGTVELQRIWNRRCDVDECERRHHANGRCKLHDRRWQAYGDPLHDPWGVITYSGLHQRIQRERGKADGYLCNHCGARACDWAFDHTDPNPLVDTETGLPYTEDIDRYIPLCRTCHRFFDKAIGALADASGRAAQQGSPA